MNVRQTKTAELLGELALQSILEIFFFCYCMKSLFCFVLFLCLQQFTFFGLFLYLPAKYADSKLKTGEKARKLTHKILGAKISQTCQLSK
jgi:hypothetical protein